MIEILTVKIKDEGVHVFIHKNGNVYHTVSAAVFKDIVGFAPTKRCSITVPTMSILPNNIRLLFVVPKSEQQQLIGYEIDNSFKKAFATAEKYHEMLIKRPLRAIVVRFSGGVFVVYQSEDHTICRTNWPAFIAATSNSTTVITYKAANTSSDYFYKGDQMIIDDYKHLRGDGNSQSESDSIADYMRFRNLWFFLTGELIDL